MVAFWRIASKGDPKRSRPIAVVAVAHDLLKLAYFVLQRGTPYEEERGKSMSEQQKQRLVRHHVRSPGKLGISLKPYPVLKAQCRPRPGKSKMNDRTQQLTENTRREKHFRKNPFVL
jgi:hypothetical protein